MTSSENCNNNKPDPRVSSAVWIIANPQHVMVQDCVVGDLVMILGQVCCLDGNDNTNGVNTILPGLLEQDDTTLLEQIRLVRTAQQQQQQYYVSARICRNVNGTDMSLFTQALMTRRKFLRALGNGGSNENIDVEDRETSLRPGWEPPLSSK